MAETRACVSAVCDTRSYCTVVCPLEHPTIPKSDLTTAKAHGRVLWLCEQVSMYALF
ncbi:hypothetical protein F383_33970 [Gossypium arboreum]|uniref:Uncharacterized protein n=1 Tax=Gossypium arboreum TaxID=29729 RepID=A0A0B0MZ04_GOSAR|nr:hypothetical protein F383_33970 [Gossypium arboreum]